MNRLASVSSKPTLKEFAQGAAQDALQPIANFIAPTVPVPTLNGRFKIYTEKNRFRIPRTLRAMGGRATELRFEVTDGAYNCEPHALDYPIDNLERLEQDALEDALKEGAVAIAEVAALAHEKKVIDLALEAAGAGTDKTWDDSADPIADVDDAILEVLKAAKYGSLMGVGIVSGATAWKKFKNAAKVRQRFVAGSKTFAVPTEQLASQLFLANPEVKTSFMVYDRAAEGLPEDIGFLLDNTILVFARKASPTRRDPSFMKTFRLMNKYMVPGSYVREDGRAEVAKFDWSEDVRVTNAAAVKRLNIV